MSCLYVWYVQYSPSRPILVKNFKNLSDGNLDEQYSNMKESKNTHANPTCEGYD